MEYVVPEKRLKWLENRVAKALGRMTKAFQGLPQELGDEAFAL